MPPKTRKGKFSSNDDPKQTTLKGWITLTPSSAASQPSYTSLNEAPTHKNPKRVATSSLESHGSTAKKSRVRGEQTNVNPPEPKTAQRPPIASTQDEPDPDSDSDDISSDEDEDDCPHSDDDGQSDELGNRFARCLKGEEMTRTSSPVTGDDFWMRYLIEPLVKHASRLGLKATPLPDVTHKRLSDLLDFALGRKSVSFVWTVYTLSKQIRERLLRLWGLFMPKNFQKLLAGPEPPTITQIYSLIDANGVYCNEQGVRLDKFERRGEVQSRCLSEYWKVALPEGDADSEDTDYDDIDEQDAEHQYSVHHHPPLPLLLYTGQTAKVIPSGNTMGFRPRWREHVRKAYSRDEADEKDS
ncbi:hypothetical protein L202_05615 [Cryptococcus amylolentus CBS 6039]|uniref:Uncharacterized protein n=1 Tax=Cryptococcus amylolentus CBS 6039 TaxID=1295533 RepID=A0A1E3HL59_9TREE|nr:hypothetical protein L202_05615 [Cryptococcus amylolentus CBS 6039]ODN77078.1 hypothetical protein L202_05615 [Cryptococcus amylolentus CBS 6039]